MESAESVPTLSEIVRSSWLTVTGSSSFGHIPVSKLCQQKVAWCGVVWSGRVKPLERNETSCGAEAKHGPQAAKTFRLLSMQARQSYRVPCYRSDRKIQGTFWTFCYGYLTVANTYDQAGIQVGEK